MTVGQAPEGLEHLDPQETDLDTLLEFCPLLYEVAILLEFCLLLYKVATLLEFCPLLYL